MPYKSPLKFLETMMPDVTLKDWQKDVVKCMSDMVKFGVGTVKVPEPERPVWTGVKILSERPRRGEILYFANSDDFFFLDSSNRINRFWQRTGEVTVLDEAVVGPPDYSHYTFNLGEPITFVSSRADDPRYFGDHDFLPEKYKWLEPYPAEIAEGPFTAYLIDNNLGHFMEGELLDHCLWSNYWHSLSVGDLRLAFHIEAPHLDAKGFTLVLEKDGKAWAKHDLRGYKNAVPTNKDLLKFCNHIRIKCSEIRALQTP